MASLDLKGNQLEQLSETLRDAFTPQRLREVLKYKLDRRLADYSLGEDYREIVFELITGSEAEGWTAELIQAARESNPGNASLQSLAQEVTLGAITPELERTIKAANPYLDVELFRTRLGQIEVQVCRIEVGTPQGTVFGTGFLVGPDSVMTNHHVMEPVISGRVQPTAVTCRFDYKAVFDRSTHQTKAVISEGTMFSLAPAEWLIDASPPSDVDTKREPKPALPRPDELDYAILRLAGSPGTTPAGQKPDPKDPPRGWVSIDKPADTPPHSPLLIMQHPDAAPLKLALDMGGVIGLNANATRLRYSVNTEGGSSGSPCFNQHCDLVALHHSGDPNFDADHHPEYNEGIPITAIVRLLTARGKRDAIGGG